MTFIVDRTADVKSLLFTVGFGAGVRDRQLIFIISLLVDEEVMRLTTSARLTISPTCAVLTTETRTVEWRIQPGSSLVEVRTTTASSSDRSMLALTSI